MAPGKPFLEIAVRGLSTTASDNSGNSTPATDFPYTLCFYGPEACLEAKPLGGRMVATTPNLVHHIQDLLPAS
jgi:hypothetical protein